MAITEKKLEVVRYWNSKKIIIHRKLSPDADRELGKALKYYTVDELKSFIDFYATILEPDVPPEKQKYFWTYKWNLYEFLKRGIKKFDGQEPSNYLKKQTVTSGSAVVFKRKS